MDENNKSYKLDVKEDPYGDLYIQFPDDAMTDFGWKPGDTMTWKDNGNGSFTLSKKKTEWVLVESVATTRMRYMVEVPIGKKDWALDTVTMEDAEDFSHEFLGEQIVSHRVVSEEEALEMCDSDNAYTISWDTAQKKKVFFTPWTENYYE